MSASTKRSIAPRARRLPCSSAHGFPSQPGGVSSPSMTVSRGSSKAARICGVRSVDRSSMTMISRSRYVCASIGATVAAMLAQTYRDLEIIVIDDRSTDRTPQILAAFDDPRLTVIEGEETPPGWLGKPWALEQGSRRARGAMLLFVDADIDYEPKAIASMVDALDASGVSMLAVLPHIEMRTLGEQVSMMMLPFFAWAGVPLWLGNRWNAVSLGLGGGVGNFVRSEEHTSE